MKTLEALKKSRSWIVHIDDERGDGNSIIVTLVNGYDFADDPGCGVKGFDTVAEVRNGTRKVDVNVRSPEIPRLQAKVRANTERKERAIASGQYSGGFGGPLGIPGSGEYPGSY